MPTMRYQPNSILSQLQSDLNRAFESNLARAYGGGEDQGALSSDWLPPVDIAEQQDRYVIAVDVPGLSPNDIEVTTEDGGLNITGVRELESERNENGYRRVERASGRFYRRFTLPESADVENIRARTENGVLQIEIPKQEKEKARKISVEG